MVRKFNIIRWILMESWTQALTLKKAMGALDVLNSNKIMHQKLFQNLNNGSCLMVLHTNFDLTILLHNTHNFCAFDAKFKRYVLFCD